MEAENTLINEEQKLEFVQEGKANVRLCNDDGTFSAFYNPAQEFNRDLSILCISTYFDFLKYKKLKKQKIEDIKYTICEALSATDMDRLEYIAANDMDSKAVDTILKNVELNEINPEKFKVFTKEASQLLYSNMNHFDIIDLDPYGSAAPLIDSALLSLKSGGLLCVTYTDMSVLCGNYPETTFYKYGSIPHKTSSCHEMAKRIALFSIASAASKYKKAIKPLFCFNAEFYIRLFLVVVDSADECKNNALKYSYVYHCRNCQFRDKRTLAHLIENKNGSSAKKFKFDNLTYKEQCPVCDSATLMMGPLYSDSMQDEDFMEKLIENLRSEKFKYLKYNTRIDKFLGGIKEEFEFKDEMLYYDFSKFGGELTVSNPKFSLFKGTLENMGYKLVQSYYDPILFKTNANAEILYDFFKAYKKDNYSEHYLRNVKEGTYGYNILTKEIKTHPNVFVESSNMSREAKYLPKPFANWGPKGKAKLTTITSTTTKEKEIKKVEKNKK